MNLQFKSKDFVHLHLHTDYSLLQSTIQIKPLTNHLQNLQMKACAITDYGNMYGAISFYSSMKAKEIHPILGYEAFITFGSRFDREASVKAGERPYYNLVLLAKNLKGYYNLAYLASKAFTEGLYHKPRIDFELLAERSEGIVGLSSGFSGTILHFIKQGNTEKAFQNAKLLEEIFGKGNFFIEIQDHNLNQGKKYQEQTIELARKADIPLVATNEAYYLTREDARAQEILLC
ncbi:MAG: PHP domain-containing protein, partial [Acidobacteria bacterium]|nr:PHP domain-containing protein [Acidobacteriota bacterium]MCA1639573.1 PHP domain-containing protein [Acidobacteriota bacterium]